jgi:hypothetical protein
MYYTKKTRPAETFGPSISDEAVEALKQYGCHTKNADGTTYVFFTPLHWNSMRAELKLDQTEYDAFVLLDCDGAILELGHSSIRTQYFYKKQCKARMARRRRIA